MILGFAALYMQLLKIAVVDAKTKKIANKDNLQLSLIVIFFLLIEGRSGKEIAGRILIGVVVFIGIFITALFLKGIGGGDCKLLANVALLLGFSGLWYTLLLASLFSLVYAKVRYQEDYQKAWIPFGPGICLSIILIQIGKGF